MDVVQVEHKKKLLEDKLWLKQIDHLSKFLFQPLLEINSQVDDSERIEKLLLISFACHSFACYLYSTFSVDTFNIVIIII